VFFNIIIEFTLTKDIKNQLNLLKQKL